MPGFHFMIIFVMTGEIENAADTSLRFDSIANSK